jgi:hypothetical protein
MIRDPSWLEFVIAIPIAGFLALAYIKGVTKT